MRIIVMAETIGRIDPGQQSMLGLGQVMADIHTNGEHPIAVKMRTQEIMRSKTLGEIRKLLGLSAEEAYARAAKVAKEEEEYSESKRGGRKPTKSKPLAQVFIPLFFNLNTALRRSGEVITKENDEAVEDAKEEISSMVRALTAKRIIEDTSPFWLVETEKKANENGLSLISPSGRLEIKKRVIKVPTRSS